MKIEIDEKTGIVTLTFNGYREDKEGKQLQSDDFPMLNKLKAKYSQMIEEEAKQQLRLKDRYLVDDDTGCVRFIFDEEKPNVMKLLITSGFGKKDYLTLEELRFALKALEKTDVIHHEIAEKVFRTVTKRMTQYQKFFNQAEKSEESDSSNSNVNEIKRTPWD